MRIRILTIVALVVLSAATLMLAQNGRDLYQQGLVKERGDGDIQGAIQIYERIVRQFASDRELVAKALLQLGISYEKLGQAKSREYFQQLVSKFPDQRAVVSEARKRLAPVSNSAMQITTPPVESVLLSFAISPDGVHLVYRASVNGSSQLWLRRLDSPKPTPIAGTENGYNPFWSPNSQNIGFFADGYLKRVSIKGGAAQILTNSYPVGSGAWSSTGVILFNRGARSPLYRVPESGGEVAEATVRGSDRSHRYPQFLPDGRHFIYFRIGAAVLSIGSLDNKETKNVPMGPLQMAMFAPPNHLLIKSGGSVYIQGFDPDKHELVGNRSALPIPVATIPFHGQAALSVSNTGSIAYRSDVTTRRQLIWLDRNGKRVDSVDRWDEGLTCCMRISPDNKTVAVATGTSASDTSVWLMGPGGGTLKSFNGGLSSSGAVWSANGDGLVFSQMVGDNNQLFQQKLNSSNAEPLLQAQGNNQPLDSSPDGAFLLYARSVGGGGWNLWALPLRGGDSVSVTQSPSSITNGRFSPDGKWVVYQSSEAGEGLEIYVQPFPGSANSRKRVSVGGGTKPQWARGGRELYFISADSHLMVTDVTLPTDGQPLAFKAPRPLFPSRLPDGTTDFAVTADGERFLVNPLVGEAPPIFVLSDWARTKP